MLQALLQLLPGRFMDLSMRVSGAFETRIVERPGLWMEARARKELLDDLRQVASRTLGEGDLTYGIFSSDPERLNRSIITIVRRRSDKMPVAFNALTLIDLEIAGKSTSVLHLGLVMVDPDERSQGLSWVLYGLTCFLMFLRNQLRPVWVSNVTQVPAVVGMVADAFDGVFPDPVGRERRSLTQLLMARQIMDAHRGVFGVGADAEFDEETFIIRNAYTGGSDDLKKDFAECALYRDEAVNEFCRTTLDYERGDDVLQIGQANLAAARKFVTDVVPRGRLAALMVAGITVVLQRVALPLWYWSDSARQWGSLRPWR